MEMFWFSRLPLRRAYESAHDSDFWFLKGHERSSDSAYDCDSASVLSENQPNIRDAMPNLFKNIRITVTCLIQVSYLSETNVAFLSDSVCRRDWKKTIHITLL